MKREKDPQVETIRIYVAHYYRHVLLYPHMSEKLFDILHDAYFKQQIKVEVPLWEYERMLQSYLNTLKN